jgi:hypothetical protein
VSLKKVARVLFRIFGFCYSVIIITPFSVVASCIRFLCYPIIVVGYLLGCILHEIVRTVGPRLCGALCLGGLLGFTLGTGGFSAAYLAASSAAYSAAYASGIMLKGFLISTLPALLTVLPFVAGLFCIAGAYVLYQLYFDLWVGLPYCLLDFSNGLENLDGLGKAFISPFAYLNARLTLWFGNDRYMDHYLNRDEEEIKPITKTHITNLITTTRTTTALLRVHFPEALASIITQYALPGMKAAKLSSLWLNQGYVRGSCGMGEKKGWLDPHWFTLLTKNIAEEKVNSVLKGLTEDERKDLKNSPFFFPFFADSEKEKSSSSLLSCSPELLQYVRSPVSAQGLSPDECSAL